MHQPETFAVAHFRTVGHKTPRRDAWSLAQLLLALTRFAQREERDGPLWSPTLYPAGTTRLLDSVEHVSVLVLDFDRGHDPGDLLESWRERGLWFVAHSTHSHTEEFPKWRAAFPLARPVPASEWYETHARLARRLAHGLTDPACKDCSRMYYLPACRPGAPRFSDSYEGSLLDPDETFEDLVGDDDPAQDAAPAPRVVKPRPEGRESPVDWYERTAEWRPLLEAAGGTFVRQAGRREEWRRPGKRDGISATTGNGRAGQDLLKVHSSSWPPFEAGEVLTKAFAFAKVHHGGEWPAAIAAIKALPGYPRDDDGGSPVRRAPVDLPPGPPLQTSAGNPLRAMGYASPAAPSTDDDGPPPDDEETYQKTDLGNAERLVQAHGHELRHCAKAGGWHAWDGRRWAVDETGRALFLATRVARRIRTEAIRCRDLKEQKRLFDHADASEQAGALSAALRVAQALPGMSVPVSAWDADPWLLNCPNGVVDLRTGELREHDPALMLTRMAAAPFEPSSDCPTWLAFLDDVVPDPEVRRFLWKYAGYSLTGSDREQCLVFLHGEGKNGKSTLVNTLAAVVGDLSRSIEIETLMATKGEMNAGQLSTIADLRDKRFVVSSEPDEGSRLNESLIKRLTGGEPMNAKYMGQNTFQFVPRFKLWISGNHKPTVRGTDEGIWRRLRLVPFDTVLAPERRDKTLPDRLLAESPGILRWMVLGALAWLQEGLGEPEAIRQATEEYRAESDNIGLFLDARTQRNPHARTETDRLYRVYVQWCEAGGYKPLNASWFGRKLKRAGVDRGFTAGERDPSTNASVVEGLEVVSAEQDHVYRGGE